MWIPESLPVVLRQLRHERRLTQSQAASQARMRQADLSHFESGRRTPGVKALIHLCGVYDVCFGELTRRTAWDPPRNGRPTHAHETRLLDRFAPDTVYLPPRDRDFAFRMGAARQRYGVLMKHLEPLLDARPDALDLERFLRDVPAGSGDEAAFDLHLLGRGATTHLASPTRLGFTQLEVLDELTGENVGCRRRPALALEDGDATLVFLPQVAVRPQGTPFTLDHLVGVRERHTSWFPLEVDGAGHDPRKDGDRHRLLGLGELRVTEPMLHRLDFAERLVQTLLAMHRRHEAGVVRTLCFGARAFGSM